MNFPPRTPSRRHLHRKVSQTSQVPQALKIKPRTKPKRRTHRRKPPQKETEQKPRKKQRKSKQPQPLELMAAESLLQLSEKSPQSPVFPFVELESHNSHSESEDSLVLIPDHTPEIHLHFCDKGTGVKSKPGHVVVIFRFIENVTDLINLAKEELQKKQQSSDFSPQLQFLSLMMDISRNKKKREWVEVSLEDTGNAQKLWGKTMTLAKEPKKFNLLIGWNQMHRRGQKKNNLLLFMFLF